MLQAMNTGHEGSMATIHANTPRDAISRLELPLYRWALPVDTGPLLALLDALAQDNLDAVVFTSAAQVRNLFEFARSQGRETALRAALTRTMIVSIGPVCSRALEAAGVQVQAESRPPKLGALVTLLRERL
jgi:uroporphyrinogen-III synthase